MVKGETNSHADEFLSVRDLERTSPDTRRMIIVGGSVIAGIVLLAIFSIYLLVQNRHMDLTAGIKQRIEAAAASRSEVLATWLEGVTRLPSHFTESNLFKLFVTEVDLARQTGGTDKKLPVALRNQLPYMQVAVTGFVKKYGLIGAYLVNREGRVFLASAEAPSLTDYQRLGAQKVFQSGRRTILPFQADKGDLVLDMVFPFTAPQADDPKGAGRTVGAMLISVPAKDKLAGVLALGPFDKSGEQARLLQLVEGTASEIVPRTAPHLVPISSELDSELGDTLPFGARLDLSGYTAVFSAGVPVANTPWMVIHEVNHRLAIRPLTEYTMAAIGLALLGTLLIGAAFVAVWWRQNGEASRALAIQYHSLASRIQAQRQLLDSINNSIDEQIGLKNLNGRYEYVNPAFAKSVAHSISGILGRDDEAIFGPEAARKLKKDDQTVINTGKPVTSDMEIEILSKKRYLTVSKAPLNNDDNVMVGIVSVTRDVTEIVERQHKQERITLATRDALVHAVEMHDPYLSGHSQRMSQLCKAIGIGLSLSDEEILTLETAAMLSQIGKLSIPKEILAKETRLTPEEFTVVQSHIGHAETTLKEIDFGLPVADTVMQMHERLDGSGYPKGLKGDQINTQGRIIAACDVYCARISPRAYRHTIPNHKAISILEENPDKYDREVVAELRRQEQVTESDSRS